MYITKNYILEEILDDIDSTDSDSEILNNADNFQNLSETELENDTFQKHVATSLQSTKHGMTYCFRCSAHTIQLCVYDGLKNTTNKEILDKARKVKFIIIFIILFFVIYVGIVPT